MISATRRGISTSAVRLARPRDASAAASRPVLKRDVPVAPAPPARAVRPANSATAVAGSDSGAAPRGGKPGSVWTSYRALPYNTKLVFWACGAMFATLGLLAADKLEDLFPARNNKPPPYSSTDPTAKFIPHEERKPKLFSVSVVDRST